MKFLWLSLSLLFLLLFSCKNTTPDSKYNEFDLLSYGVPIEVHAPEGAKVSVDDLGIVKDITIVKDNYNIQILEGDNYNELEKVVQKQKTDAINSGMFSKIIEEDEQGFIFEKKYAEDRLSYDFRYVRIQGDKEYVFQTGLMGQFTLEEVKEMYKAVE